MIFVFSDSSSLLINKVRRCLCGKCMALEGKRDLGQRIYIELCLQNMAQAKIDLFYPFSNCNFILKEIRKPIAKQPVCCYLLCAHALSWCTPVR